MTAMRTLRACAIAAVGGALGTMACASGRADRLTEATGGSTNASGSTPTGGSTANGGASSATSAGGKVSTLPPDSVCLKPVVSDGSCPLIDDLEDGDNKILPVEGRSGSWYAYNDGTGTTTPTEFETSADTRTGSTKALHTTGADHTDYGGGFGFSMACVDATAYSGMSFMAKGTGKLYVTVATAETRPKGSGGDCVSAHCNDNFGKIFELTADWAQYSLTWDELYQVGWGDPATFYDSHIVGADFSAYNPGDGLPYGWDFWIDDVSFTGGSPSATGCKP